MKIERLKNNANQFGIDMKSIYGEVTSTQEMCTSKTCANGDIRLIVSWEKWFSSGIALIPEIDIA